jgi:transaldolase
MPIEYRRRGQAVWLDTISRKMIETGKLKGLAADGSVYGVTSNPTIFGQAVEKDGGSYKEKLTGLAKDGRDAFGIYDEVTRWDIADGADILRPLHDKNAEDGWISLEVLPSLAAEADKTVAEATRLNRALARPNVFIKVPSTPQGVDAIHRLIGAGISINVTLMFNRKHYHDVAMAYVTGLEDFAKTGGDLSKVHSVASFFVSRVDTMVDKMLDEKNRPDLKGKAGIANCRVVYQDYLAIFRSQRFLDLAKKGARVQRPLWASTGTKNPAYSDLLYVENLIGADTVNTMPEKTLDALLDHGKCPGDTILEDVDGAKKTLEELKSIGIDIEEVGERLQVDGVKLFAKSYDELLSTIESRRAEAVGQAPREVASQMAAR